VGGGTELWVLRYGTVAPTELSANYFLMNSSYDHTHPIEDLYKHIQDVIAYAYAGNQPCDDAQIINSAYNLLFNAGVLQDVCNTWRAKDLVDKMGVNFKTHFSREHHQGH
jgi:hypothetical protein